MRFPLVAVLALYVGFALLAFRGLEPRDLAAPVVAQPSEVDPGLAWPAATTAWRIPPVQPAMYATP